MQFYNIGRYHVTVHHVSRIVQKKATKLVLGIAICWALINPRIIISVQWNLSYLVPSTVCILAMSVIKNYMLMLK